MPSAECLKQFVSERLAAAAEDIFAVFQNAIVEYEEELERRRKLFDAAWNPVVKLRRTELPQQRVSHEKVFVDDQPSFNQNRNPSVDQEEPEPPQIKEQQEELAIDELRLKQDPEGLQLCSANEENNKSEGPTVDWHPEEPEVNIQFFTQANSKLLQLSLPPAVSQSQAQDEGEHEIGKSHLIGKTSGCDFSSHGTIEQHKGTQTVQKPFVFQQNSFSFSLKTDLPQHITNHTSDRPHVCQICGKGFNRKFLLKEHGTIHTGERPYVCHICTKTFSRKNYLSAHQKIHIGEKTFVCHICNRSFLRKANLISHKRVHTGEKPHVCKVCGQGFTHKCTLNLHERMHDIGFN
ncbi:uncharacterized protein LOC142900612 [Nelusetta ayraudi]|uniref:uncharacterized protein LOC142900612 n=1 Tax=Nelusetta ayraudi TaxID=303726 RepID=UPI003F71D113